MLCQSINLSCQVGDLTMSYHVCLYLSCLMSCQVGDLAMSCHVCLVLVFSPLPCSKSVHVTSCTMSALAMSFVHPLLVMSYLCLTVSLSLMVLTMCLTSILITHQIPHLWNYIYIKIILFSYIIQCSTIQYSTVQ